MDEEEKGIIKQIALLTKKLRWEFYLISEDEYEGTDQHAPVTAFIMKDARSSFNPEIAAEDQNLAIDDFDTGDEKVVH